MCVKVESFVCIGQVGNLFFVGLSFLHVTLADPCGLKLMPEKTKQKLGGTLCKRRSLSNRLNRRMRMQNGRLEWMEPVPSNANSWSVGCASSGLVCVLCEESSSGTFFHDSVCLSALACRQSAVSGVLELCHSQSHSFSQSTTGNATGERPLECE